MGLETEGMVERNNTSFSSELRRYLSEIGQAVRIPAIHNIIIYLALYSLFVPSFSSFSYYFMLDVVQLSKFTYSMLTVLGFFCLLIGSALYKSHFKDFEYRNLIVMEMIIGIFFAPFSYMLIFRINLEWGISDLSLIIFTDIVQDIVAQCFVFLPMAVMFAKITPKGIEGTTFAMLAGFYNFKATMRGWTGSWINDAFVGVT